MILKPQQYCARFRGSLREILNLKPKSVEGQRLPKRYQKIRDHLLLFLTDETSPPTNNARAGVALECHLAKDDQGLLLGLGGRVIRSGALTGQHGKTSGYFCL